VLNVLYVYYTNVIYIKSQSLNDNPYDNGIRVYGSRWL